MQHNLFDKIVCTKTLYNYIELQLTKIKNIDLKQKLHRKPKVYKKIGSIDLRPPHANERIEFGHWKIDLIIGKRSNDEVLLTLDERMTRFRHIIRLPGKKAEYAVAALQNLKFHYGDNFCKIFKSITADNGSQLIYLKFQLEFSSLIRILRGREEQMLGQTAWSDFSFLKPNRFPLFQIKQ